MRKHGADLAEMTRPAPKHARRARPRLLAGTSIGLAVAGTAAVLVLSAASSPPAFAVSRNSDGTWTVSIQKLAAVHGANAKLAALGIRARLVVVSQACTVKALPPTAVQAMQLTRTAASVSTPQIAVAKLDPSKIPPGKWQVIPAYRVNGTVHVDKGHLIQGQAPTCFSTVAAPPCQPRGTSNSTATQAPLPAATWVVGCYVHVPVKQQPNAGNSGNSGNSGTSGNS